MNVEEFGPPAFATRTAPVLLTGGSCVDGEGTALHGSNGVICEHGTTLEIVATLSEALDASGVNNVDDIALKAGSTSLESLLDGVTGGVFNPVVCGGSTNCKFTLNLPALAANADPASVPKHTVKVDRENGTVWFDDKALTLALTAGETKLEIGEDETLDDDTLAVAVHTSIHPTVTYFTSDQSGDGPDGVLDGVEIRLRTGIAGDGTVGLESGLVIVSGSAPFTPIASTVEITDLAKGVIRVTASNESALRLTSADRTNLSDLATDATSTATATTPMIPYNLRIKDAAITYKTVYDETTGELKSLEDVTTNVPIGDGAAPIVIAAEFRQQEPEGYGHIFVVASEGVSSKEGVAYDTRGFRIGENEANSLQIALLNLNVEDLGPPEIVIPIEGVRLFVLANVAMPNFSDDPSLFLTDYDANVFGSADVQQVAIPSAGVEIEEGDPIVDAPEVLEVFANRDENGDFTSVTVVFDHVVDEVDDGKFGAWTATVPRENSESLPVSFKSADISGDNNLVVLEFPIAIKGDTQIIGGTLAFEREVDDEGNVTSGIKRAGDKEAYLEDISDIPIRGMDGEQGTGAIFAQKVTGQITGAGNIAGSVIHASVVIPTDVPVAGPSSSCTVKQGDATHTGQLSIAKYDSSPILKAIRAGQRQADLVLRGIVSDGVVNEFVIAGSGSKDRGEVNSVGAAAGASDNTEVQHTVSRTLTDEEGNKYTETVTTKTGASVGAAGGAVTTTDTRKTAFNVPVKLDVRSGAISGRNVSNCKLAMANPLTVVSNPSIALVNAEGRFETVVGVNENLNQANVTGCIVLTLERMQFDEDGSFVRRDVDNITSCDPAVGSPEEGGNYLAFSPAIGGGAPTVASLTVDINRIASFDVADAGGWQVYGMPGLHRSVSNNQDAMVPGMFICAGVDEHDAFGEDKVVSILDDSGNLDELFSLSGNDLRSYIELNGTTTFTNLRNSDIGNNFAFAFRQDEGGDMGECSYLRAANPSVVFDLGRGWTLAQIGDTCPAEVAGVILVGDGDVAADVNTEGDAGAVNAALAAHEGTSTTAFIYSPQGKREFNSCGLSL
jgi:hypothetical protein